MHANTRVWHNRIKETKVAAEPLAKNPQTNLILNSREARRLCPNPKEQKLKCIVESCGSFFLLARVLFPFLLMAAMLVHHSLGLPPLHPVMSLWASNKDRDDKKRHDYRKKTDVS